MTRALAQINAATSATSNSAGSRIRWRWRADPGIDVFVELMGGEGDPAKRCGRNRAGGRQAGGDRQQGPARRHGVALAALAERTASRSISRPRSAAPSRSSRRCGKAWPATAFARVYGILNGTCNYILTRMEQDKLAFDECLKDAQRLGYAEADPTFDIEGHDTAQKLAILASLAFGTRVNPDAIYVEGISSITPDDLDAADALGYRVKLLGVAMRTEQGIEQRVHPTMVPKESAIAQVMGVTNAVSLDADGLAPITLVGPGAGGAATASSVVADLGDIARGVRARTFRPAGRSSSPRASVPRCSVTRAATISACWRTIGPAPSRRSRGTRRRRRSRWNRSSSAIPADGPMAATIRAARRRRHPSS